MVTWKNVLWDIQHRIDTDTFKPKPTPEEHAQWVDEKEKKIAENNRMHDEFWLGYDEPRGYVHNPTNPRELGEHLHAENVRTIRPEDMWNTEEWNALYKWQDRSINLPPRDHYSPDAGNWFETALHEHYHRKMHAILGSLDYEPYDWELSQHLDDDPDEALWVGTGGHQFGEQMVGLYANGRYQDGSLKLSHDPVGIDFARAMIKLRNGVDISALELRDQWWEVVDQFRVHTHPQYLWDPAELFADAATLRDLMGEKDFRNEFPLAHERLDLVGL